MNLPPPIPALPLEGCPRWVLYILFATDAYVIPVCSTRRRNVIAATIINATAVAVFATGVVAAVLEGPVT